MRHQSIAPRARGAGLTSVDRHVRPKSDEAKSRKPGPWAPGSEPVVADIDGPEAGACRVTVDRDLGEATDPRRRATLDPELRPRGALVVAESRREAETAGTAARHVMFAQYRRCRHAGRDPRRSPHAGPSPTRAGGRARPRRLPRSPAVVRDADEGLTDRRLLARGARRRPRAGRGRSGGSPRPAPRRGHPRRSARR